MSDPSDQAQHPAMVLNAKVAALALRNELEKIFMPTSAVEQVKTALQSHVSALVQSELAAARQALGDLMAEHLKQANEQIGELLHEHLATLRAEHPTAAAVLDYIAKGLPITPSAAALEPAPAAAPSSSVAQPPEPAEPADELATFPTLEQFVALGYYADTYEYQKAQWTAKHPASPPADVAEPAAPAITTTENPEQNGPSESAASAGSQSA